MEILKNFEKFNEKIFHTDPYKIKKEYRRGADVHEDGEVKSYDYDESLEDGKSVNFICCLYDKKTGEVNDVKTFVNYQNASITASNLSTKFEEKYEIKLYEVHQINPNLPSHIKWIKK